MLSTARVLYNIVIQGQCLQFLCLIYVRLDQIKLCYYEDAIRTAPENCFFFLHAATFFNLDTWYQTVVYACFWFRDNMRWDGSVPIFWSGSIFLVFG